MRKRRTDYSWIPQVSISIFTALAAWMIYEYKVPDTTEPQAKTTVEPLRIERVAKPQQPEEKQKPPVRPKARQPDFQVKPQVAHDEPKFEPLTGVDLREERIWNMKDGQAVTGKLKGISVDYSTAYVLADGSIQRLAISDMEPDDKQFCVDAMKELGSTIMCTSDASFMAYEGNGFKKLQSAIVAYSSALSTVTAKETTAQAEDRKNKAFQRCIREVDGIDIKVPVVIEDVAIEKKKGKKQAASIAFRSLYEHFFFTHTHLVTLPEDVALRFDKGDVWWMSLEISDTKGSQIGEFKVHLNASQFAERLPKEHNSQLNTGPKSHLVLPVNIRSLKPTNKREATELLNQFDKK